MSQYNLNDNVQDSFEFILGGFTYQMRYPTVEETESMQEAIQKAESGNKNKEILDAMCGYISSTDSGAPDIAEALKRQNIRVIRNFTEMIKSEFGSSNG